MNSERTDGMRTQASHIVQNAYDRGYRDGLKVAQIERIIADNLAREDEQMDDLISRQAAIDTLESGKDKTAKCDIGGFYNAIIQNDIDKLRNLPSAQSERTKGKWIHDGYDFPHGNDWIHCSICGKKGINVPADLTNFCPNCGADMRGEKLNESD